MQPLIIIGVAVIAAFFLAALLNFRLLLYPLIPYRIPLAKAKPLHLAGNTLFISDLHLKNGKSFEFVTELRDFIGRKRVSNLVIVGDLFDSPTYALKVLSNPSLAALSNVLGLDGLPIEIFWVIGSPSHDPVSIGASETEDGKLIILGQCASITCNRVKILAYHGHDLSAIGAFAHAWDRFISKLSLERLWKKLANVDRATWIVFGHTHIPGLDSEERVANCGGWMAVPLLVRPSRTGIFLSQESDLPEIVQIA